MPEPEAEGTPLDTPGAAKIEALEVPSEKPAAPPFEKATP